MFIIANLLSGLTSVLNVILTIFYWLIIVRAVVSWFGPDPYNVLVQFLYKATDPILDRIRARLPMSLRIPLDISPIIAFLIIIFLQSFLIQTLFDIAYRLKYSA